MTERKGSSYLLGCVCTTHARMMCVCAVQVAIKKVYAAADVSFSKGEVTVDTTHPTPVTIKVSHSLRY